MHSVKDVPIPEIRALGVQADLIGISVDSLVLLQAVDGSHLTAGPARRHRCARKHGDMVFLSRSEGGHAKAVGA